MHMSTVYLRVFRSGWFLFITPRKQDVRTLHSVRNMAMWQMREAGRVHARAQKEEIIRRSAGLRENTVI